MDTWLWIVIAAAVVLLIIVGALAAYGMRRKQHVGRERAAAIRAEAEHRTPELRKAEAEAQGTEAEAQRMRAEADQLETIARERRERVDEERGALDARLQEADRLDPDTRPGGRSSST